MYVFPLAGENPIRKKSPLVGVVQSEPDFGDIRLEIEQPTQINKPNRASGEIIRHMCLRASWNHPPDDEVNLRHETSTVALLGTTRPERVPSMEDSSWR